MPAAVDGLKECSRCRKTKPVSEFSKNKTTSDGLRGLCRVCDSARARKYYQANRESLLKKDKEYRAANKEHIAKKKSQYYRDNREYILKSNKKYFQKLPAGVYKIENTVTGKIYIGQSTSYPVRWRAHRTRMRRGIHPCLQHDYDKHGLDSFEFSVIQEYPSDTSRETLFEHEQRLIDEYLAEGKDLYNIDRNH
jgi:hypothetical protein